MSFPFSKPVAIALFIGLGIGYFMAYQEIRLGFENSAIPGHHAVLFWPTNYLDVIFSALAFLQTCVSICFGLIKRTRKILTIERLEFLNWLLIIFGSLLAAIYFSTLIGQWYSAYLYESFAFYSRALGDHAFSYFFLMAINLGAVQLFWSSKIRGNWLWTLIICLFIIAGKWFDWITW